MNMSRRRLVAALTLSGDVMHAPFAEMRWQAGGIAADVAAPTEAKDPAYITRAFRSEGSGQTSVEAVAQQRTDSRG
jgi:hypothetical protein